LQDESDTRSVARSIAARCPARGLQQPWPALDAAALIRIVAERGKPLATTEQIRDGPITPPGDDQVTFDMCNAANALRGQLAALRAAHPVVGAGLRIRTIRIASQGRNPRCGRHFRKIRRIRIKGAGKSKAHAHPTSR
jgi:hypothetical protein